MKVLNILLIYNIIILNKNAVNGKKVQYDRKGETYGRKNN